MRAPDQLVGWGLTDVFRLDHAIEKSQYLLGSLRNFNTDQWAVRYPCLRPVEGTEDHTRQYSCDDMPETDIKQTLLVDRR